MDEQLVPDDEDLFSSCQTANVDSTEKPIPFVGLKNVGNSCYFNSVMQVLLHCPILTKFVNFYSEEAKRFIAEGGQSDSAKKMKYDNCNMKKCKVFCEFLTLCEDIFKKQAMLIAEGDGNGESGSDNALEPRSLLENLQSVYPSFEPFAQQDAQECFQCFLDILNDSILMLSNMKELDYTPFSKNEPVKVLGGSKSGKSIMVSNDGRDVKNTVTNMNVLKPVVARKRGIRSLFKNPLKRSRDSGKENTLPQENSHGSLSRNITASKALYSPIEFSRTSSIQSTQVVLKRRSSLALSENKRDFIVPSLKDVPPDRKKEELIELMRLKTGYDLTFIANSMGGINDAGFDLLENFHKRFVEGLFQGEIVNESRCLECENSGCKVETFMDVSLPVCQSDKDGNQGDKSPDPGDMSPSSATEEFSMESKCSVSWGMASFTSREMLNGENKYYCSACKRYCEGEKRLLLNRLPPLLTFHLKRFTSSVDGENSFGVSVSKINTCFEVPLRLSLKKWCSSACNENFDYNLFAVIIHSGTTVSSGHYLAYIKIQQNTMQVLDDVVQAEKLQSYYGQWLETDDERVRVISDEKFKQIIFPNANEETTRTPYLLFYCNSAIM